MLNLILENTEYFSSVYEDMKIQFPADELKDFDCFIKLLNKPSYRLYSVVESDNVRVGYVICITDDKNKFLWIDYIAIYKNMQCKGYGHKIFYLLKEKFAAYTGIYLEVEKPDINEQNTIRRINFYKSLGAKKLNLNYIYPNKNGGLPMDLYFIPFSTDYKEDLSLAFHDISCVFDILHSDIPVTKNILEQILA